MNTDKEDILRKIKHCLALSKSANENEAAMALRQAHAMMEKYGITHEDIQLADIQEAKAETTASKNPHQYQVYLARIVAHIFGCKFYIGNEPDYEWHRDKPVWMFVGLDIYAAIASYAFDVLSRQLKQARKHYIATELKRVRILKNKYARADKFCLGWVNSVERLITNLVPPNDNQALIDLKMKEKNLTTCKALDRVSNSKAQSATNDFYNGRIEGKNARLNNAMHGSTVSGLLE